MECSVNQMASHLFNDGNSQNPSWGGKKSQYLKHTKRLELTWLKLVFSPILTFSDLILHYYVLENDDLILADLIHLFFFMPPVS